MEDVCLDLDSTLQSTASSNSSPHESTSPSSSFHHSSPPTSIKSATPAYRLAVTNLSYSIHPESNPVSSCLYTEPKPKVVDVLKSVSFIANSSEILAIVGPSGAGKSTLLRIISGRVKCSTFNPRSISLNERFITSPGQLRKICGFVTQKDNLLPLLTVKETLMFTAKFRLRGMSAREKDERVKRLMQELGLENVADSYVGDEETRGISGGERKRVAVNPRFL